MGVFKKLELQCKELLKHKVVKFALRNSPNHWMTIPEKKLVVRKNHQMLC